MGKLVQNRRRGLISSICAVVVSLNPVIASAQTPSPTVHICGVIKPGKIKKNRFPQAKDEFKTFLEFYARILGGQGNWVRYAHQCPTSGDVIRVFATAEDSHDEESLIFALSELNPRLRNYENASLPAILVPRTACRDSPLFAGVAIVLASNFARDKSRFKSTIDQVNRINKSPCPRFRTSPEMDALGELGFQLNRHRK